jgi:hypothetical protein
MAGTDPTGYGGVVPGYSAKREIELLVEAGFKNGVGYDTNAILNAMSHTVGLH